MRNNHWKFRKIVAAAWPVVPQLPDRRKRGGFLIEKRPRVHHTPSFWYRGIATRVTPGSRAAWRGPAIGRVGSDSLARERRLAGREAIVFLLSARVMTCCASRLICNRAIVHGR